MQKYSQTVRRSFERDGAIGPGVDVPLPTLEDTQSQMAVPAMVRGELVGVLVVDSPLTMAFEDEDEAVLAVVATPQYAWSAPVVVGSGCTSPPRCAWSRTTDSLMAGGPAVVGACR